ncbi:MAG: hypothetical protein ACU85E_17200 [Gammaproteobacteria bacterium]
MANMTTKVQKSEKSNKTPDLRIPLGQDHEDISDDFSALLSVFGINGISDKLKQKALKIVRR